jgi:hypothetical protein
MDTTILNNLGRQHRESPNGNSFISSPRPPSLDFPTPALGYREDARDFKDRHCSANGEGKQPDGGLRAKKENLNLIKAIVISKVFTAFERAFSEATGLPVCLRPVEFLQLPLRGARNEARFCALMARANRTCAACLKAQAQVGGIPNENPKRPFAMPVCARRLCRCDWAAG